MVFSKTAHPMFYPPPRIQYLEVIWVSCTGICLGPRLSPFCSCGGVCLSHPVIKKHCDKVDKTCTSVVLKVDQPLLILYITDLRKSWMILNLSKNCIETKWI